MFMKPLGPDVTPEQAEELDEDYFLSRPREYFLSRIGSLVSSDGGPVATAKLYSEFAAKLPSGAASEVLSSSESDRALQIAVDALSLRHHAAEALVRLYYALTVGRSPSVWVSVVRSPHQMADLVTAVHRHLTDDSNAESFRDLVLLPSALEQDELAEVDALALGVLGAWLEHALWLLGSDDLDTNGAHNKIKHGLAVRARKDVRASFIRQGPSPDGTIPLSVIRGPDSFDLIKSPTVEYLSQPAKRKGEAKQGLELTTLALVPQALLAEAFMLATTLGAMFHVAAAQHFYGRRTEYAPYPKVPTQPTPMQLLRNEVVGIRSPVTTPPGGGTPSRVHGISVYGRGFIGLTVDVDGKSTATVVED